MHDWLCCSNYYVRLDYYLSFIYSCFTYICYIFIHIYIGGQPEPGQTVRVDYAGNSNVIEQAGILGVERIILITR